MFHNQAITLRENSSCNLLFIYYFLTPWHKLLSACTPHSAACWRSEGLKVEMEFVNKKSQWCVSTWYRRTKIQRCGGHEKRKCSANKCLQLYSCTVQYCTGTGIYSFCTAPTPADIFFVDCNQKMFFKTKTESYEYGLSKSTCMRLGRKCIWVVVIGQ